MLGFGGERRRREALAGIAAGLPGALAAAHPVERAAVLLVGNCLLDLAARLHGSDLADDPRAAGPEAAGAALDALLAARDGLAALAADEGSRHRRATVSHLGAAELAALTVGLALDPALARPVALSWKASWGARARLRDAVVWLRRYEREAGVEAVPRLADGTVPSDLDLLRAGGRVPAFLRRRP